MAPAFYWLTLGAEEGFFQAVIVFHIIVTCEELAITLLLDEPRADVRSVFSLSSIAKSDDKQR